MSFPEQLRVARLRMKYTQQQVADLLGVTKSTYCGYETGKRQPDVLKIKLISGILQTSGDILLETGLGLDYFPQNKKDPTTSSHGKVNEAYSHKISDDEYLFILAYRQASPADRQIIDNIISRYSPSGHTASPETQSTGKAV